MADIEWVQGSDALRFAGRVFKVSCRVRNELNGLRDKDNLFYTTDMWGHWSSTPSQPRVFPAGEWRVTGWYRTDKKYLHPVAFRTNARQQLDVWEVKDGVYVRNTGVKVWDYAYLLHWSEESEYTQGCVRLDSEQDVLLFKCLFDAALESMGRNVDPKQKWLSFEVKRA